MASKAILVIVEDVRACVRLEPAVVCTAAVVAEPLLR